MHPIAIVGLSCRFPGAPNAPEYWRLLAGGVDAITEVPADRWDITALYHPDSDAPGRVCTKWGGFLPDIDRFDAAFFNISPREAERVDPQQRLILEVAWEALEDAGIAADRLTGTDTGVFVAISHSDYARLINSDWARIIAYNGAGMYHSIAANRLSYTLDLRGPSMVLDTACSSSLVAVHIACQQLRSGETSLAIVGAVNLNIDPVETIGLTKGKMLSPDGRCKTFDDAANGYVRSDGCGVLILKRLDDALKDGDRVRAVVLGSAVNQDGLTNGLYAPSGPAQQAVIRRALNVAGVAPADISYVEAHGTGTALGDPIEMKSIMTVLGANRPAERVCWVGSVKTNVGHLEAASGMAGLIKTVLALEEGQIPPHLHLRKLNRYIRLDGTPFRIPLEPQPWPPGAAAAGVSAFGFGGTNAHVIIQRAASTSSTDGCDERTDVLTLSAKNEAALRNLATAYEAALAQAPARKPLQWHDVCHTASHGRSHFKHRLAVVAQNARAAANELQRFLSEQELGAAYRSVAAKQTVAFLFSGQGSHHAGMGRVLYQRSSRYRRHFDECVAAAEGPLGADLRDIVFGTDAANTIGKTEYAQPALFALEYALARQLMSWGLQPHLLLGHSLGEIVAACVAGVLPLQAAMEFVVARGRLMQTLPTNGAMLSISAPLELAGELVAGNQARSVNVAAHNGPASFVLSGPTAEIALTEATLRLRSIPYTRLAVSHAFHSVLMQPIGDSLRAAAQAMPLVGSANRIVSNLDGKPVGDRYSDPGYWVEHALSPVMFWPGVQALLKSKCTLLVEIGPHPVLCAAIGSGLEGTGARLVGTLRRGADDPEQLANCAAKVYAYGGAIDWKIFREDSPGSVVSLPTYPFQRQRHWFEVRAPDVAPVETRGTTVDISLRSCAYLVDHRVNGEVVLPAAEQLVLACAGAHRSVQVQGTLVLEAMEFKRMCRIGDSEKKLSFSLAVRDGGPGRSFTVSDEEADCLHGRLGDCTARSSDVLLEEVRAAAGPWCTEADVEDFYAQLEEAGLSYGPAFRAIVRWRDAGTRAVIGELKLPGGVRAGTGGMNPILLDGSLQLIGVVAARMGATGMFVPAAIARLRVHVDASEGPLRCRVEAAAMDGAFIEATVEAYDSGGRRVYDLEGVRLAKVTAGDDLESCSFLPVWVPDDADRTTRAAGDALIVGSDLNSAGMPAGLEGGFASLSEIAKSDAASHVRSLARCHDTVVFVADAADAAIPSQDVAPDCMALAALVKALSERALPDAFRLVIATRGGQRVLENDVPSPSQAAICGLARVVAMEHPQLDCRIVDLPEDGAWQAIIRACSTSSRRAEMAWRGPGAYRLTLQELKSARALPPKPFRLVLQHAGDLETLCYVPAATHGASLGRDEVEVEVRAAALNFRDALNALGLLKDDLQYVGIEAAEQIPFGGECSGVVLRAAAGSGFAAGDAVIVALTPGCLASTVKAQACRVIRKPPQLTFAQAATVTTAYLTVYHAFRACADVQPGQSVLVHAASGGVGQAAVRYLQRLGARVFATTSKPKHSFLARQGVAAVVDSRSIDFREQILELTGGKGVDVVLNSLSGDFIPASLDVLAPDGVFVEIGKRGVWTEAQVRAYRGDVRYRKFDLLELESETITSLLRQIELDLACGRAAPLPYMQYPARATAAAFRQLAAGRHIGKLIIDYSESAHLPAGPARLSAKGAYVVTGGLGALGLRLAAWLAAKGARHIVLVGRRPPGPHQQQEIDRLTAGGADVCVLHLDIAAPEAVQRIENYLTERALALKGAFHLAGVLDDAIVVNQSEDKFRRTLQPKADGAWNLHRLALRHDGCLLVFFSSLAGALGSPGQANYAAANAFLDGLAEHRRATGAHGLSIDWGPFEPIGLLSGRGGAPQARFLTQAGLKSMSWAKGTRILARYLASPLARILIMPTDAPVFREKVVRSYPSLAGFFEDLDGGRPATRQAGLAENIRSAAPSDAWEHIHEAVTRQLADVLRLAVGDIDSSQTWSQLGVDSLLAMEIKAKLEAMFGVVIDDALTLQSASVAKVTAAIHHLILGDAGPVNSTTPARLGRRVRVAARRASATCQARLVCFHHLGGSAAAYRGWSALLPDDVELVTVELPGRDDVSEVPRILDFNALVADIVEALLPYLDRPFALYGHSMGSLFAYETCRRLAGENRACAAHLFVGALWPPPAHAEVLRVRGLSRSAVLATAEVPAALLADPELERRLQRILDRDYEVLRAYRHISGPPLEVPITGFYGTEDIIAGRKDLALWQSVTARPITVYGVEGRHIFHMTNARSLVGLMAKSWTALETDSGHEPVIPEGIPADEDHARRPILG